MSQPRGIPNLEGAIQQFRDRDLLAACERQKRLIEARIYESLRGPVPQDIHGLHAGLDNTTTIRNSPFPRRNTR